MNVRNVRLTDLDELVQNVKNITSKSYIIEAINAYRGGAYRAAIISVWIAVVCDIISKIRFLANKNDGDAGKLIHDFHNHLDKKKKKRKKKELIIFKTWKERF